MGAPEWIARMQSLVASAVHLRSALVHAAQRLPGFRFDETMAGQVTFDSAGFPSGQRDIVLQLRAQVAHFGDYLRDGRTRLSGTATIDGVVDSAPVSGSIWILPHRSIVRYEVFFSVGETHLRLAGQKNIRLLDFRRTVCTLPSRLYDESGHEVGHGTVMFDWNDLSPFLRSFTPVHADAAAPSVDVSQDGDTDAVHLSSRLA